jgi:general secretion pathway protein K
MSCRRTAQLRVPRGAAVVLAMLLAALAATIAVTLFADQQRWTRAVMQRRDQVQAQALAMAGVQWARQILDTGGRPKAVDHLGEPWAISLPPIPLDNGEIRGAIADATARLNVNALGVAAGPGDPERDRIERLFAQRGGPAGAIDAIADWIDVDDNRRPDGAEDAAYGELSPPGIAANGPVVRVAELAAVRGVSLASLAAVAPYLIALPAGTPVNVNTASPEVLATIVKDLRSDALPALVADRAQRPFASVADFRSRLPPGASLPTDVALAVRSDFFLVTVDARQGTTIARARALLRRTGGASAWPSVVWQVVE